MIDVTSGSDAFLNFQFIEGGEPFIPDVGTVTYTVLNHSGTPIVGLIDVPVTTTTSTFQIPIVVAAINNTINVSKKFERRVVIVKYQRGGIYGRGVINYRVISTMYFSVTPTDVRNFIGLQEKELEDKDIDLINSYLYVQRDLDTIDIDALLTSGTTDEIAANEMIKMRTVLDVLQSVRQRISQEETNGITGFKRLTIKDFDSLEMVARGRYEQAFSDLSDVVVADITLILTTTDADPITGA